MFDFFTRSSLKGSTERPHLFLSKSTFFLQTVIQIVGTSQMLRTIFRNWYSLWHDFEENVFWRKSNTPREKIVRESSLLVFRFQLDSFFTSESQDEPSHAEAKMAEDAAVYSCSLVAKCPSCVALGIHAVVPRDANVCQKSYGVEAQLHRSSSGLQISA